MNFIYSYLPSYSATNEYNQNKFEHDSLELMNFPERPDAQIKVLNNQIQRTDEKSLQWINGWKNGTTLDKTIEYINGNVLSISRNLFHKHIADLESQIKEPQLFKKNISQLNEDLGRDMKLLEGLKKIEFVYTQRYQGDHVGLKELNESIQLLTSQIDQEWQHIEELINKYNSAVDEGGVELTLLEKEKWKGDLATTKSPSEDLEAYCYHYNREITPKDASLWIEEGNKTLKSLYSGNSTRMKDDPHEANEQATSITWALMNEAISKGDGYREGSFVIDDPQGLLYNFLHSHPNKYDRLSSHFAKRSPKMHEGIDIFDCPMPAQKRTLLFTQVDQMDGSKVLFLKPENYSADHHNKYDTMMHGYEFFLSKKNKIFYPGSDDLPSMRKERVPVETSKIFENIVSTLNQFDFKELNKELFNDPIFEGNSLEKAKLYGIAFMNAYVQAVDKLSVIPGELDTAPFFESIKGLSDLDKRTGREAFIHSDRFI
jgi:hypothetical protein